MRVLLCHDYYQQRGGEDLSFESEAALLESRGHTVLRHTVHNDSIAKMPRWRVALGTIWSRTAYREVRALIRRERPDVMHCTNTFPLLSPAIHHAAKTEGVPVVQSLRNYRLLCPGAYLLRDGNVCEDCLTKLFAWPGVRHGCYRGSAAATAVVAAASAFQRLLGSVRTSVDLFFTPTEFARSKFIQAGFPADKIAVKPNFINPDPGPGTGAAGGAVFVGRLSAEKGITTLLDAWKELGSGFPLKVIGDGPLAPQVQAAQAAGHGVQWLGNLPHAQVLEQIGRARLLIMPSLWFETFGRTMVEAFAKGTPVIASRLGCMTELVEEGVTGWLFESGNAVDLARQVRRFQAEPDLEPVMRDRARAVYERRFTADVNYEMLLDLYRRAGAVVDHATPAVEVASHRALPRTTVTSVANG